MTAAPPVDIPALAERVAKMAATVRAKRVVRWYLEWPPTRRDAPPRPEFVRIFESVHGPAPASAERVLAQLTT